jgi:cyclic pyranopterin phosphate synthase
MILPAANRTLSLRISVTAQCQLRCPYCMPAEGVRWEPVAGVLGLDEILRFVRILRGRFDVAKVRITGGEPLLRPDIVALVRGLAADGVADLALTTNAVCLAEMAAGLRQAGLRRVNVHIDTLDPALYRRLTGRDGLPRAIAGVEAARAAGLTPVKLNMVVLRGINDGEVVAVARFGLQRACEVRFLEMMPIGAAADRHREWFVPSAEVHGRLAAAFDLEPLPVVPGAPSRDVRASDAAGLSGVIGFISPCSEPFCADCRRLRLTAAGRLLGCLARAEGPDVAALLRADSAAAEAAILDAVEKALALKRADRRFADQRAMAAVGG